MICITDKEVMSESSNQQNALFFELQPGKNLDLQINHPVPLRLKLALVGYELGRYIILKYPKGSMSEYRDVLTEGNVLIVRYLMEGNKGECYAFRSTIRSINQYPEKLLFIEYPKKIENRQLRLQQRTSIHLPAVIMLEEPTDSESAEISGVISDISAKGCGFNFKTTSEKTKVNKRDIFVSLQNGLGEEIKIPARVCNSRNEKGKVSVGIQFLDDGKIVPKLLAQLMIENSGA